MNTFIDWKYNNKTILTTKENDFHCSISTVKTWLEDDVVKFSLLGKNNNSRQVFQLEPIKGVNKLEVWVNNKYHQHDIILPIFPKI